MGEVMKKRGYRISEDETVVYLTICEIIDNHKVRDEKNDKRVMSYMDGLFTADIVMPVKKKISKDYINHFFFYRIMKINPGYPDARPNVNELPQKLLKYRKNSHAAINTEELKACYAGEKGEEGVVEVSISKEEEVILKFPRVYLHEEYILEQILDCIIGLAKSMKVAMNRRKMITSEEARKKNKEVIYGIYRDIYVSVALYEIFLQAFFQEEWEVYVEYMELGQEAGVWLEIICSEDWTEERAAEFEKWREKALVQREDYWIIEMLEKHERMWLAMIQCLAFVGQLNMENAFYFIPKKKIVDLKRQFRNFIFEDNGHGSKRKLVKDFCTMTEESGLFDEKQFDEKHPAVKKMMEFWDRISDIKNKEEKEELENFTWEMVSPIFARNELLMNLDISEKEFQAFLWKVKEAEKNMLADSE